MTRLHDKLYSIVSRLCNKIDDARTRALNNYNAILDIIKSNGYGRDVITILELLRYIISEVMFNEYKECTKKMDDYVEKIIMAIRESQ